MDRISTYRQIVVRLSDTPSGSVWSVVACRVERGRTSERLIARSPGSTLVRVERLDQIPDLLGEVAEALRHPQGTLPA